MQKDEYIFNNHLSSFWTFVSYIILKFSFFHHVVDILCLNWEMRSKKVDVTITSIIVMSSRGKKKKSWHSPPPHNPFELSPFFQAKDHCSFDLQQIGRLVAHHTAVTLAFIYLHMQACIRNVLNPYKPRCRKHAARAPERQKYEGCWD